jgi:hypothetical protein
MYRYAVVSLRSMYPAMRACMTLARMYRGTQATLPHPMHATVTTSYFLCCWRYVDRGTRKVPLSRPTRPSEGACLRRLSTSCIHGRTQPSPTASFGIPSPKPAAYGSFRAPLAVNPVLVQSGTLERVRHEGSRTLRTNDLPRNQL